MASNLGKPVRWNLLGDTHRARSLINEAKRLLYLLPSLQQELKQYGIFRRFHNGAYVRIKEVFGQLIVDMFYPTVGEVARVSEVESVHELFVLRPYGAPSTRMCVDKYIPDPSEGLKKVWTSKLDFTQWCIAADKRYVYAGTSILNKDTGDILGTGVLDFSEDSISGGDDDDDGFYLAGVCDWYPRRYWCMTKIEKNPKSFRTIWSEREYVRYTEGFLSVKADKDGVFIAGVDYIGDVYDMDIGIRVEKRNCSTGALEWVYRTGDGNMFYRESSDEDVYDLALSRDYVYVAVYLSNWCSGTLVLNKKTGARESFIQDTAPSASGYCIAWWELDHMIFHEAVSADHGNNLYVMGSEWPGWRVVVQRKGKNASWAVRTDYVFGGSSLGIASTLLNGNLVTFTPVYYNSPFFGYLHMWDASSGKTLYLEGTPLPYNEPEHNYYYPVYYDIASYNKTTITSDTKKLEVPHV